MVRNEGERLRRVIVSAPRTEYFRLADLGVHNIAEVADRERAISQHKRLTDLIWKLGAHVVNLKELAGHPNSVFTRDTSLVTPRGYIRLRMGLRTRRGEEEWMAEALDSLGLPCAGVIEPPGTVEGGDVILAGKAAFVSRSERTNSSGIRQLSHLLMGMDYEIRTLDLPPPHLHIGGAMSVIGPKSILCCRRLFPRVFFEGFDVIEIPCPEATSANVISLGDQAVIAEKSDAHAARTLAEAGFIVRRLDLSEFVKGRGGPSCLILPVERADHPVGKRERAS